MTPILLALLAGSSQPNRVALADLNLSGVSQGWGSPQKDKSVDGRPLSIGGVKFEHGLGTHAVSVAIIALDGKATNFEAMVGVDDEVAGQSGDVDFHVVCDDKEVWGSGVMKAGEAAKSVHVELKGVRKLVLKVGNGGDEINYDHADWAEAFIDFDGKPPKVSAPEVEKPYILTPPPPKTPRINGPVVLGARPGREFVWRVPATGDRPMRFSAVGLPTTMELNPANVVVSGKSPGPGTFTIGFSATNPRGTTTKNVKLVVGDALALTPPMGWNSWNCFATAVDEEKVKSAAKAFVDKGLVDHGWQYVNIDDCWSIIPHSNDPILGGPTRDPEGNILTNGKFPNMRYLTDSIHAMGLRAGIYSSPGPTTCGGYASSYKFELNDAQSWARWGFDYVKYDWCSYSEVLRPEGLDNLQKPYKDMRAALDQVDRDIVYSLCQYGMGEVWKWGADVGGNCWRTTGDITDSWESMSNIGFGQNGHEQFAGPGHWNDPDMLVVGWVGWGPQLHPSKLTPSEQYTHITLWCLLSSPLLIGCDLTRLDDFTLNLLTNDEVIAVNQDPLGKPARRVRQDGDIEVWARPLFGGSWAVGVFNRGESEVTTEVTSKDANFEGAAKIRDLWRQKEAGVTRVLTVKVRRHGCELFRFTPPKST